MLQKLGTLKTQTTYAHTGWSSFSFPQLPTTGTHSMRLERPLAASKGTQEGTWH